MFVGMTRAREELILTAGPEPSPFLEALPPSVKRETSIRWERPEEQICLF